MVRLLPALAAVLLLLGCIPGADAKAQPLFYETLVAEDTEGDFAPATAQGALDLVALYISEKHAYDADKQKDLGDFLVVRFESASEAIQCGTLVRFSVFFEGVPEQYAEISGGTPSTGTDSCVATVRGGTGVVNRVGTSVLLVVSHSALGVAPGATMKGIWAQTAIVAGPQVVPQDVLPHDNANAPGGEPAEKGSYAVAGAYAFVTVDAQTPLQQNSVGGQPVKYEFNFITTPSLTEDQLRIRFEYPEGWSISPSQGRTGVDPEGQVGTIGGTPREFFFTVGANAIVAEGDSAPVLMRVYSDAGGYVEVAATTSVTGPRIIDPDFTVDLYSTGPFVAGEPSRIHFLPLYEGLPIVGSEFKVEVSREGKKLGPALTTAAVGDGSYEATYIFPSEGEYKLDVIVSSQQPSPFRGFTVTAENGGMSPGPVFAPMLIVVLGVALFVRRNR